MGKPCRAYRMMPYKRSKYTHQIETDVCAESSEPLSFVFTHFLYQIMQALIMLVFQFSALEKSKRSMILFLADTSLPTAL